MDLRSPRLRPPHRAGALLVAALAGSPTGCSQSVDGGTSAFSGGPATAAATVGTTSTATGTGTAATTAGSGGSAAGTGSTGPSATGSSGSSGGASTGAATGTSGSAGGVGSSTGSTGGASSTGALGGSTGGTTGGAACNVAILVDFSTCPSGFTTGKAHPSSAPSSWACGDAVSGPGGTGMWATNLSGGYVDDESSYLESPSISLADCQGKTVSVRVRHWYDIESGYDGGNIQISTDGGSTWQVAMPTGHPYDEVSLGATYSPPFGQPGFSGPDAQWRESFVDLTPYVGSTDVRLRFVFGSDFLITYSGWYIDEVEVLVQ